jgi:hypothetical protein
MGQYVLPAHPVSASGDDVRLAWAEAGTGPTLVKAADWLTHLEYDKLGVWMRARAIVFAHDHGFRYVLEK